MGSDIEGIGSAATRSPDVGTTRRALLKHGATGAAAAGLATMWAPSAWASGGGTLPGALKPRSAQLMLINRLTQGWTEQEGANYAALGSFSAYRQSLLYPSAPFNDSALDAILAPAQFYLNANPAYLFTQQPSFSLGLVPFHQNAMVLRAILSKNQALERMLGFWNDHFNTWVKQEGQFLLKTTWDREVLRPHALGSFFDLLRKTTEGGSMLLYLDQAYSSQPNPNENYARELLELHTLGESHPFTGVQAYTEADVLAAAKALTGYSYDDSYDHQTGIPTNPATFFYFQWKPALHVQGPKTFMGASVPVTNSQAEGQFVIDHLLNHPDTATHVAYKMARRLVGYSPSQAVVNTAAGYYTAYSGDIRVMMTSLLGFGTLAAAGQVPAGFLEKSPFDFVCALARALGISFGLDKLGLLQELQRMGNAPMEWPAPDGFHHDPGVWIGSVFARWEFANKLLASPTDPAHAADKLDGIGITDDDLEALIGPAPTIADLANRIDQILTGGVMTDNEKEVLIEYMTFWFPIRNPWLVARETFALAASSPTFQYS